MEEQQSLLNPHERELENLNESSLEEWSDGSSCSSYYSDSDSSVPEWESSVDESTGELLFINCQPYIAQSNNETTNEINQPLAKSQLRHSTRGKFLRLIRRRESKRRSKRYQKNQDNLDTGTSNKVKFQECNEGEERTVLIKLDVENRFKLGRRAALVESLLGLNVSPLTDGNKIMIAGFTPDSETKNLKNIKIGDWLKSINEQEVNFQNLNSILETFSNESEVTLKLQCVAGVEVTKDPPVNELHSQSNFVRQLINTSIGNEEHLLSVLCEQPLSILYINTEKLNENNSEYDEIIYCYPLPFEKNVLCNSRGIYLTLHHLLNEVTKTKPKLTSAIYLNRLCHIVYTPFNKKILLLMLPDNRVSSKEIILINSEIIRLLEFTYQTVDKALELEINKNQVDHFFSRFFTRILSSGLQLKAQQSVELKDLSSKSLQQSSAQFEEVLPVASQLVLPNEAQIQIDEALTELEASDYREWNEEPLDCQRLFTILGSALYHSGYLLASHFVHSDLIDVHCYCRQQGLLHLTRFEPVKCMVLWREVFPVSCNRGLENCENSLYKFPSGRRYLLIVGSGKDLLAVLMEAGGCTEPPEDNTGPDAFYVEEAQATLAHIQELGLSELADRCIINNSSAQVVIPEIPVNKRKTDFLGNFTKSISPNQNRDSIVLQQKKPEVTSILKRQSSDQGLSHSGSLFSLPDESCDIHSEDSASQGGYSEKSEVSDEPVLGRRAARDRKIFLESDEDSDIDDYGCGSQMSCSSYDLSELRQSLLSDTGEFQSVRLTSGNKNVLFHYVQLDETEGLLLSPPECKTQSQNLDLVLENFRKCSQSIHSLFQNTLRFKNMTSQEMAKSVINKSLIAIKEHGILFECPFQDEYVNNKKCNMKIKFWVIGRLFYMPHPREVYVCYEDTVPQNIIEIAFKLGITG